MVQWLGLHLPIKGVWVQFLVGELRFHMPCSQKTNKQTENRINIVTNSIKPLKKWSTLKKKILKKKYTQYIAKIIDCFTSGIIGTQKKNSNYITIKLKEKKVFKLSERKKEV